MNVSRKLRQQVYTRDGNRCISCGTSEGLSIQHRAATGMGGAGKKAPPMNPSDLLTMCILDNQEAESAGQPRALQLGYKIRKFRGHITADRIPVYERQTGFWYLLNSDGTRTAIIEPLAYELLLMAGNLERQVT